MATQLRREHEVELATNAWWLSRLRSAYYEHESFTAYLDLEPVLARVTSERVQATAATFVDAEGQIVGVLRPAP